MSPTLDLNTTHPVSYAIPLWLRDEQIKLAIQRVKGRIKPFPEDQRRTEPLAVVCFGPSLNDTWKGIKEFKYVVTCSGAHKFLFDWGLKPSMFYRWWHVEVDPRAHKTKLIGKPHKDVHYLISSTCHQDVFDHLEGFNVKLWHVFATDEEAHRVLPRGEWALTGGSSVGLRAMTIARFFGFTDLHIFGMDGNESDSHGKHAAAHPNQPKGHGITEYEGVEYKTTPSLLECAKQTFHELDQMPDVKATFHGDGLVQHMAKNYVPQHVAKGYAVLGFNKPELIGEEYRKLNAQLHRDNLGYGVGGGRHAPTILKLAQDLGTGSILDYGCGKGYLAKAIPYPIWEYDPAIPEKADSPRPADLVACLDVLEHVEPEKLQWVLDDLRRCVKKLGYFVIHTGPSTKTLADGRNAHLIQKDKVWWTKQLRKYFDLPDSGVMERDPLLHVVVAPMKDKNALTITDSVVKVSQNGTEAKFYVPNKVTKWRADTLLTKEPITIEWINSFKPGEVFFDVGANVGGYSVWAGVRGAKVYAFEPEADNYSLLLKNLGLNKIEPNAYCVALSDKPEVGLLHMSQQAVGQSCHTFNEAVGPDLKPRKGPAQGCLGMTLDSLVQGGLPPPDHLKIDVDGLEFRVIRGAEHILTNGLKSLLVEVNSNLAEHRAMVEYLTELGFSYDPAQVEAATRKEGPFKGCAEYVFRKTLVPPVVYPVVYGDSVSLASYENHPMSALGGLLGHLIPRLYEAEVIAEPFPHIVIENALPNQYFADMLASMPDKWTPIENVRGAKYSHRYVADPYGLAWDNVCGGLKSEKFRVEMCRKFGVYAEGLTNETLLIHDEVGYAIGPHTDHPDKVISALFYLRGREGTSLYVPRDAGFTCPGGPHHPFRKFKRVKTVPFKENSLFVFLKSDHSFHGVQKTKYRREVLLYDIRRKDHA